jgi:ATPase
MRLPPIVTQYSKNYASPDELHDILLLSRPDYTVFDELRNDADFKLYVDLRLAGIGMIGVIHATTPIDAVQRFIGRVELGMIPSIVDTVIYIKNGHVDTVYELAMTVKLPTGLREAELARPVVEVRDFLTGELAYEIYTFGEQTVVIPVRRTRRGAEAKIQREVERLLPGARLEFSEGRVTLYVPKELSRILSRRLRRIRKLGDKYGLEVRVIMENA